MLPVVMMKHIAKNIMNDTVNHIVKHVVKHIVKHKVKRTFTSAEIVHGAHGDPSVLCWSLFVVVLLCNAELIGI